MAIISSSLAKGQAAMARTRAKKAHDDILINNNAVDLNDSFIRGIMDTNVDLLTRNVIRAVDHDRYLKEAQKWDRLAIKLKRKEDRYAKSKDRKNRRSEKKLQRGS